MFFLVWRFQKRLEHYNGMKGPFYGGEYSRSGPCAVVCLRVPLHVACTLREHGVLRGAWPSSSAVRYQVLTDTLLRIQGITARRRCMTIERRMDAVLDSPSDLSSLELPGRLHCSALSCDPAILSFTSIPVLRDSALRFSGVLRTSNACSAPSCIRLPVVPVSRRPSGGSRPLTTNDRQVHVRTCVCSTPVFTTRLIAIPLLSPN